MASWLALFDSMLMQEVVATLRFRPSFIKVSFQIDLNLFYLIVSFRSSTTDASDDVCGFWSLVLTAHSHSVACKVCDSNQQRVTSSKCIEMCDSHSGAGVVRWVGHVIYLQRVEFDLSPLR